MGKKNVLQRGFKAKAEKLALEKRKELGLNPCDAMCAFKLAELLKIGIYGVSHFIGSEEKVKSTKVFLKEWSALTMLTKTGNRIIIHNDSHTIARQQSNLMHEISHIILEHKHESKNTILSGLPLMREYNELQEEEAKCLGATLQLPKLCLLWANKRNMTYNEIAEHYNASVEMVRYRINITGLLKLFNPR